MTRNTLFRLCWQYSARPIQRLDRVGLAVFSAHTYNSEGNSLRAQQKQLLSSPTSIFQLKTWFFLLLLFSLSLFLLSPHSVVFPCLFKGNLTCTFRPFAHRQVITGECVMFIYSCFSATYCCIIHIPIGISP